MFVFAGLGLMSLGYTWGLVLIMAAIFVASYALIGLSRRVPPMTVRELGPDLRLIDEEKERQAREKAAEES